MHLRLSILAATLAVAACSALPPEITQSPRPTEPPTQTDMQQLYTQIKTPFKYGIVLRGDAGKKIDCPSIFRRNNAWFMVYVSMDDVGYQTYLATSDNLLDWKPLGKILSFQPAGWDQWQSDGGAALVDPTWGGSQEIQPFDNKYWVSYIGGALQGYETDPLAIGLAWTTDPTKPVEWTRLAENPILSKDQPDVREFEKKTLYKSTIIRDPEQRLGAPLVMYYNAKVKNGYERIGMATSQDMIHWKRFGDTPVVANGEEKKNGMSGDPQLVKIGDTWVMFYFGSGWGPKAFDTFAASRDLVHWTKWDGPKLIEPSEPFDQTYAHKPWVLMHDGIVYHFYCAVGDQGRVIALATSKDLRAK